jgi:hypothetical protein
MCAKLMLRTFDFTRSSFAFCLQIEAPSLKITDTTKIGNNRLNSGGLDG